MKKQLLITLMIITSLFSSMAFAQKASKDFRIERVLQKNSMAHLFEAIDKSASAIQANLKQYEKKISCFYIGYMRAAAQRLARNTAVSFDEYDLRRPQKKAIKKLEEVTGRMSRFCTNVTAKISLKGFIVSRRANKVMRARKKLFKFYKEKYLFEKSIVADPNEFYRELKFIVNNLETHFESALAATELEKKGHQFKPKACVGVGQAYLAWEIVKEAELTSNPAIERAMEELRDLCFNERGLKKYLRDVNTLRQSL